MWPFTSAPAPTDAAPPSACPVDHSTRESWLAQQQQQNGGNGSPTSAPHSFPARGGGDRQAQYLSTEREVSSIPRWLPPPSAASSSSSDSPSSAPPAHDGHSAPAPPSACPMHEGNAGVAPGSNTAEAAAAQPGAENWVYPSPASFYTALQRKDRNPRAADMNTVVPIHNAVNERVWQQVLEWEREALGLPEGAEVPSKLVSFVGRPKDVSPRARWKTLIGYTAPFDRHDWLVDRPLPPSSSSSSSSPSSPSSAAESTRIRYVIDFYTGRGAGLLAPDSGAGAGGGDKGVERNFVPNLAFFIDCRPAVDGWEGVRMRFNRYWGLGGGEEEKP
ncbi:hypothetical protein JCM10213_008408 [Rhodosporidiobolus nylandii]